MPTEPERVHQELPARIGDLRGDVIAHRVVPAVMMSHAKRRRQIEPGVPFGITYLAV